MDRTSHRWSGSSAAGPIGPRRAMFGRPRPRRRVLPLLAAGVLLVGVPALVAMVGDRGTPPAAAVEAVDDPGSRSAGDPGGVAATADRLGGVEPEPMLQPPVFASYEGLQLRLPSAAAVLVGFHEASQRAALPLLPVGRIEGNANTTRFRPPPDAAGGPPYVVMSSRGRTPAATSAVDVLLRDDDPVLAPVTGRVTDVRPYQLYGKYPDHRIEIAPADRPDLRVVLIHVRDVRVAIGDAVEAGRTPVAASANRFSFGSHIDRYTEPDRWPHVHLEVKSPEATEAADG